MRPLTTPHPLLGLDAVSFAYPHGPAVLHDVQLRIERGDAVALLGANGSGKSTLMKLMAGALQPQRGQVLIDAAPAAYDRAGRNRARSVIQLVLQEPDDQIFGVSVRADVSYGPTNQGLSEEEIAARVEWAMERAEITDLAERVPQQLSYGQRKRVSLAGALAMRPRVLLLDEPTAGLDPAGSAQLLRTLALLREEGTAIVLSTHDVNLAYAFADTAAVLTGGVVRSGACAEIMTDTELIEQARLELPWAPLVSRALGRDVLTAADVLAQPDR